MTDFRILVTGSRDWTDTFAIGEALLEVRDDKTLMQDEPRRICLVDGECPTGADRMANHWAVKWGWKTERHPADWEKYGKAAGYRRNAEMVALGADICLAFQRNGSKGTQHTIDLARKAGIPVRIFTENDGVSNGQRDEAVIPEVSDDDVLRSLAWVASRSVLED